jgi:hypothetical protein
MKKIIPAIVIIFPILFYMCNEDSGPLSNNNPVIDPITNTWTTEADSDYTFFFRTFDSLVTRGIFFGKEFHPVEGETDLCGFFDGTYVEFDVRRPSDGRIKFKGKFSNNNRIELTSSEGSIVITR